MRILVVDVGGTNVKVLASGKRRPIKIPSGPRMTPALMVEEVLAATAGWEFDVVSIGYPGPVEKGKPALEPWNLAGGWVRFDYKKAFRKPVRIINDAAMQALGSYAGGTMLFLGLGTGLG
jgi:polyphosphate glucokinase